MLMIICLRGFEVLARLEAENFAHVQFGDQVINGLLTCSRITSASNSLAALRL